MSLISISRKLCRDVDALIDSLDSKALGSAAYIYNPLRYARIPHEKYLENYGHGPKEILLLGMNPGPFGMAQTGVPFGDVTMVAEFLGIRGKVTTPKNQHPKRLITGFDCPRSEVSGTRLWGFARDRFGSPDLFFKRFFVVNYCPLVFMEESGRNLTPDKLPKDVKDELCRRCDEALRRTAEVLRPKWVLGVGGFAQKQAERALDGLDLRVGTILHPSPASPAANRGWAEAVEKQLAQLGIAL